MQWSMLTTMSSIILIGFHYANGIDNGRQADPGEFKYSVRLTIEPFDICGGGIISVRHILTAAHCVWEKTRDDVKVLAGANYLYDEGVRRNVRGIVINDEFKPATNMERSFCRPCLERIYPCVWEPRYFDQIPKNDIAVLMLDQKLPLNDLIGIIPYKPIPEFLPFCPCDFSGWGRMNEIQQSLHLRATTMSILSPAECKNKHFKHRRNEMCAMDLTRDTAPMKGDSGNLLVCNDVAVGMLSVGTGSLDFPAIFTKIADHVEFIDGVVGRPVN